MDTQFTQRPGNDYREGLIVSPSPHESAVAWCAVFAGAVASAALSLILLLLGTGFGLTLVSPWSNEGISSTSFGITSIVGITIISLLASALGGYLAGRLRTRWINTANDEVFFRDTAHGFLSWSVATLATAALLTTVVGTIISGGVKAGAEVASSAATVAGNAVVGGAVVGGAVAGSAATVATHNNGEGGTASGDTTPLPYLLDSLLRRDANTPPTNNPYPPANADNPLDTAATNNPQTTAGDNNAASQNNNTHRNSPNGEIARIFMHAVTNGSLPEEDLKYAGQLVAQSTGLDQPAAEQRVTDTFTRLQTRLRETETAAREAADKAREVSSRTSLWLFISLLGGAFIASLMAVYGGRQRDL
jgi:hypothetical protein